MWRFDILQTILQAKPITLSGSTITPSQSVRNLRAISNTSLSFENTVGSVCRSIFLELRGISHGLSVACTKQLIPTFILPRLDYCNSMLDVPGTLVDKLQMLLTPYSTSGRPIMSNTSARSALAAILSGMEFKMARLVLFTASPQFICLSLCGHSRSVHSAHQGFSYKLENFGLCSCFSGASKFFSQVFFQSKPPFV